MIAEAELETQEKTRDERAARWLIRARRHAIAGRWLDAAHAYQQARDGCGRGTPEHRRLEEWRGQAARRALERAPRLVLVLLRESFYTGLDLPALPMPVPDYEAVTWAGAEAWEVGRLLECLRLHLLRAPDDRPAYTPLAARLAHWIGRECSAQGSPEAAERHFGLAQDFALEHLRLTRAVARGCLLVGDLEGARGEFERARAALRGAGIFTPAVWLELANLCFGLGRAARGRAVLREYLQLASGHSPQAALEFARRWAAEHHAWPALLEALREA